MINSKRRILRRYSKDFNQKPIERKHIILMDGTWNDESGVLGDQLITNIAKLRSVFIDDDKNQIVRYHRGAGNDNSNGWFNKIKHGLTGKQVKHIVDEAYARFLEDWQPGDKIYIFGFSRGAAGARVLASKIEQEGIPEKFSIEFKPKENKETKVVEQAVAKLSKESEHKFIPEIEFLGVWDTVSAFGLGSVVLRFLGISSKDIFTNRDIASNIQKAVHLLAIDETRRPFIPSLMNHKPEITEEVWFPGVHADVGGSYKNDEIAKVTLHFMLKRLEAWNKERSLKPFLIDESQREINTAPKLDKACLHYHGIGFGESLRHIFVQQNGVKDTNTQPKLHRLYYDLNREVHTYSVIKVKKKDREIPVLYKPFNVKELSGSYDLVD